jgi:hypothetical protein
MALALLLAFPACSAPRAPEQGSPQARAERPGAPVEFESKWRGLSNATVLLPAQGLVSDDGRFDAKH